MNGLPSAKYKQTPNEIEKNSLNSEATGERFNFLRLIKKEKVWQENFNEKIYDKKKLKLRSLLEVGEEVLVLALQLKKKTRQENFRRAVLITIPETFLINNRQKIEGFFYWLKSSRC